MLSDSKLLDYCYGVINQRFQDKGYGLNKTLWVDFDEDRGGVYVECSVSGNKIRFHGYPSAAMVNKYLVPFIDKCAIEVQQHEKENKEEELEQSKCKSLLSKFLFWRKG